MKQSLYAGVFVAAMAAAAGAETYYVSPDGDDANPGTEDKPWKTLQQASRSVKPGDTVRIKAGQYTGRGGNRPAWLITQAGTQEAPITYKAYGDGEVLIHNYKILSPDSWTHVKGGIYSTRFDAKAGFGGVFRNGMPLVSPSEHYPVRSVDDLHPNFCYRDKDKAALYVWLGDGSDPGKSDMRVAPSSVVGLSGCHYTVFDGLTLEYGYRAFSTEETTRHVTIRNCTLRSIKSQGIISIPEGAVIENNLFQKIGSTKFQHGMYGSLTGVVVRHNVFEEIAGSAVHQYPKTDPGEHGYRIYGNVFRKPVQFWDDTPRKRYLSDLILWARHENWVYNNVFYGGGKRPAISITRSENRIFNNTFVGCPVAVGFGPMSRDNTVQNNIFVDCDRAFIDGAEEAMPQKTFDHNIYWSTTGAPKWRWAGSGYTAFEEYQKAAGEAHSRCVDPGLVGPADARLKAGSPAIDAGIVLKVGLAGQEIVDDAEGKPRAQGAAPDIGAYEFGKPEGHR